MKYLPLCIMGLQQKYRSLLDMHCLLSKSAPLVKLVEAVNKLRCKQKILNRPCTLDITYKG